MDKVIHYRNPRRKPHFGRKTGRKPARLPISGTFLFNLTALAVFAIWSLTPSATSQIKLLSLIGDDTGDTEMARFGYCHEGGGSNCVVDGDTFYYRGQKIRIADIDTPETHDPACAEEAQRGAAATQRLQALLNAGAFSLSSIDRDTDIYGRKLRQVFRSGTSLGGILVDEGLARAYGTGRRPWC